MSEKVNKNINNVKGKVVIKLAFSPNLSYAIPEV